MVSELSRGFFSMNSRNGNRTLYHFIDDELSRVDQGPAVSRKSRELFGPKKPAVNSNSNPLVFKS